ncbi:MAG: sel1 repeat family protein, partial [Proteobacteria bacterium]|nr:sel1 repeat family protein [Pseudomonadota bacterium]
RATVLPQPEPGHAILRVTDLGAPPDGLAISLQRQQGPDSHLADDGWRRTEAWLVPAHIETVQGALEFHLGPEICDRLAGTSTVRLRIKEPDIGVVGATVVAWPQMLTSGAIDPSARSQDDLVRLRRPTLRVEPPARVEPELPPPLILKAPELPPRLPPEPEPAPPPPRSNATTWLVTMVVLIVLLAGAGYAWLHHRQGVEELVASAAPPAATPAPEPTPAPAEPAPPSTVATPAPPIEPPKKASRLAISEYLATKPTPEALLARGKDYARGGDLKEAFLVWRAAAEAGNPQAELEVAGFYDPMQPPRAGFPPDGARAADWYERAALAGNVEAQRRYGLLLAKGGAGLPADPAKARTWLQQAAAQNDAEARKALDALPK